MQSWSNRKIKIKYSNLTRYNIHLYIITIVVLQSMPLSTFYVSGINKVFIIIIIVNVTLN